ncbi:DUF6332 family protein [Streptomyces sp. NPDC052225]|uniref:DUF6332 family protein n=1 Tax=Streptomyces sp. NPDC052225 TaxID=3154949 RepID=UPI003421D2FE
MTAERNTRTTQSAFSTQRPRTTQVTRRTQAERDAMTVEIGFALATGALLGGAVFLLFALPVLFGALTGGAASGLLGVGATAAGVAFVVRVARVLWRFGERAQRHP